MKSFFQSENSDLAESLDYQLELTYLAHLLKDTPVLHHLRRHRAELFECAHNDGGIHSGLYHGAVNLNALLSNGTLQGDHYSGASRFYPLLVKLFLQTGRTDVKLQTAYQETIQAMVQHGMIQFDGKTFALFDYNKTSGQLQSPKVKYAECQLGVMFALAADSINDSGSLDSWSVAEKIAEQCTVEIEKFQGDNVNEKLDRTFLM